MAYTLVIAEKPAAAQKIAEALADGTVSTIGGAVKAYKCKHGGKELVVAPAVGHLFHLTEEKKGPWTYPVFSVAWTPIHKSQGSAWQKKYYDGLAKLAKGAEGFVSACDFDIEGSTIAFNILQHICNTTKAKRMKFSTLTKAELREAYESASPELDFPQIEAGLARHTLDYFWGINTSRALTLALKAAGTYKILSAGRVQGPALALIAEREKAIAAFQPTPYWELALAGTLNGEAIAALHEHGRFLEQAAAAGAQERAKGPAEVAEVTSKRVTIPPPPAFDLTTLQREAYAFFSLSPKQTLDIAQKLYEAALISYPRTASQQLPERIGYAGILEGLARQKRYEPLCDDLLKSRDAGSETAEKPASKLPPLAPVQGPKTDPAHPAIYPTGAKPQGLSDLEARLYDLIARRFLAAFAPPAVREALRIVIAAGPERFLASGARTVAAEWLRFAGPFAKLKEQPLPPAKDGDPVAVASIDLLSKQTQPPPRFTQASLLKELEKRNLGTKATRATILETLYDRGYVKERSLQLTELGKSVAHALEQFCPEVLAEELTRQFEQQLDAIQSGDAQREAVVQEARAVLTRILAHFKSNERSIGTALLSGVRAAYASESQVGPCPSCGKTLLIRRSKFGKQFIGCSGYPACTQTFSLPQKGRLGLLDSACGQTAAPQAPPAREGYPPKPAPLGFPGPCPLRLVQVRQPRKRPWQLCILHGFARPSRSAPAPAAESPEAE
ncbi:MAG TPA: DNA topoisomerase I [archaeon]|nr:DNA topoisomerase I [archaeon]